jgi:hypothetical protein
MDPQSGVPCRHLPTRPEPAARHLTQADLHPSAMDCRARGDFIFTRGGPRVAFVG